MAVELKEVHKIDFANISNRGLRRRENHDGFGKFPNESADLSSPKGQLFLIADAKSGNPAGSDAAQMAIRIIQENYFSYPSNEIAFCLQRAFDIANRQLYQHAKANGLQKKFGATCSALVLTDKHAYVAHVGDCRVYRIGERKVDQLTMDHTHVPSPASGENNGKHQQKKSKKPKVTRALGVKLGIKVDIKYLHTLNPGEHFLLCTDGLKNISDKEIQTIILTDPPQQACNRLIELSRERGSQDDTTVQIVKYYHQEPEQPIEIFTQEHKLPAKSIRWPAYIIISTIFVLLGFLMYEPLTKNSFSLFGFSLDNSKTVSPGGNVESTEEEFVRQKLIEAAEHLKFKRWDKAAAIYQAILENNDHNMEALEGLAIVADAYRREGDEDYRQQKWAGALLSYKKSIALKPDNQDLSGRIAECERNLELEKAAEMIRNTIPKDLESRENEPAESPKVTVDMFESSQWQAFGLYEHNDFRILPSTVTFFDNLKIKKLFYQQSFEGVELAVVASVLSGSGEGKFGIILGHKPGQNLQPKNFYLFTIDKTEHFTLQKINQPGVETLVTEVIKPGIISNFSKIYLRVKCLNNFILMYANGELLKIVSVGEPIKGGVGLYSDPHLSVEFSQLQISPVEQEQKP